MSMMQVCGPVFCPDCPPIFNRQDKQVGVRLDLSEADYSGCGQDMANCPKCGHGFAISFKIDKVTRAPDWDVNLEEEKEACRLRLIAAVTTKEMEVIAAESALDEARRALAKEKP